MGTPPFLPDAQLVGLPDFQTSVSSGAVAVFGPFGAGPYAVMPADARLATRGGVPAISLSLVKQTDQVGTAGDYATLDIALSEDTPLDDALALARQIAPDATVQPVVIDLGFARLMQAGANITLPADLTVPVPLGWSAAEGARWTHRLDFATGGFMKTALLGGSLLVGAQIEFSVRGVAARAPASIDFVPSTLIAALGKTISGAAMLERLADPSMPLTVQGSATRAQVARAMADRIAAVFGVLAPTAAPGQPPGFQFADGATAERVTWDLSRPAVGARAFLLALSNAAAVPAGVAPSLIHEVSVPALDLGFREIVVEANLPRNRVGIPILGVRVVMPPNPPGRPSGINTVVQFSGAADIARTTIQIDPDEALTYDAVPFAVVAAGAVVRQLEGAPIATNGPWAKVPFTAFPMTFAHIVASDRLLAKAAVAGVLTYTAGGKSARLPIALSATAPEVTVAVPNDATDPALTFTATEQGGATATFSALPKGTIRLDLPSFPGYGPHRFPIAAHLPADSQPLAIELASEDNATTGTATLAPGMATATWGYVSASPFHAGFRVRKAGGAWSAVLQPPRKLFLKGDGTVDNDLTDVTDPTADMPPPTDPLPPFDLAGAHFVPNADGSVINYVPDAPSPELDGSGRPTLMMVTTPQSTMLQLGAQLGLTMDQLNTAVTSIAKQIPALANARLNPAMIGVTKAVVTMTTESGAEIELASSKTSTFPPYNAVFSANLPPDRGAAAISAVRGRKGVLFVDYTISAMGGDPVVKRTDIASWFSGSDADAHIRVVG